MIAFRRFEGVISQIFGAIDKPPLGMPPEYVKSFISNIGELNNIDSLVLKLSCEEALYSDSNFINPEKVFLKDDKSLVPMEDLEDSLEMLDRDGFIKLIRTMSRRLSHYQITTGLGISGLGISGLEALASSLFNET